MRELYYDEKRGKYKWRENQPVGAELERICVNLPNFLPSTLPVAAMIIVARWFYCDMIIAWLSVGMLGLHALCGIADIMANHYRATKS